MMLEHFQKGGGAEFGGIGTRAFLWEAATENRRPLTSSTRRWTRKEQSRPEKSPTGSSQCATHLDSSLGLSLLTCKVGVIISILQGMVSI